MEDNSVDTKILGIPENACILLWKHVAVNQDGRLFTCCRYRDDAHRASGHNSIPIPHLRDGISSGFMDGELFDYYRNKMLAGEKLDECSKCWSAEARGGNSMRTSSNYKFANYVIDGSLPKEQILDVRLEYLELGFSNTCNMACRICGSEQSSKWASIETENGITPDSDRYYTVNMADFDVDLSHLRMIKIVGGEPLLAKEHTEFIIKLLKNHNNLDKLEIAYHTNGTTIPNKIVLDFWKKLKGVEIVISVDGFGSMNDFLRPSQIKWDTISKNVEFYIGLANSEEYNMFITTHTVVSRFNVMQLKELNDWILSNNLTGSLDVLYSPEYMAFCALTDERKLIAKEYIMAGTFDAFAPNNIERIISELEAPTNAKKIVHINKLPAHTAMLDNYFKQDVKDLDNIL
jgi:uncharacterized Fe-S cluster-containing radical SAM superfamily protein